MEIPAPARRPRRLRLQLLHADLLSGGAGARLGAAGARAERAGRRDGPPTCDPSGLERALLPRGARRSPACRSSSPRTAARRPTRPSASATWRRTSRRSTARAAPARPCGGYFHWTAVDNYEWRARLRRRALRPDRLRPGDARAPREALGRWLRDVIAAGTSTRRPSPEARRRATVAWKLRRRWRCGLGAAPARPERGPGQAREALQHPVLAARALGQEQDGARSNTSSVRSSRQPQAGQAGSCAVRGGRGSWSVLLSSRRRPRRCVRCGHPPPRYPRRRMADSPDRKSGRLFTRALGGEPAPGGRELGGAAAPGRGHAARDRAPDLERRPGGGAPRGRRAASSSTPSTSATHPRRKRYEGIAESASPEPDGETGRRAGAIGPGHFDFSPLIGRSNPLAPPITCARRTAACSARRLRLRLRGAAGLPPRRLRRRRLRRGARLRPVADRHAGHDGPPRGRSTGARRRSTRCCASRPGSRASSAARSRARCTLHAGERLCAEAVGPLHHDQAGHLRDAWWPSAREARGGEARSGPLAPR